MSRNQTTQNNDPVFQGIIVPMVTPLTDDQTPDITGLHRLIGHLLRGGVHGLFILGTTGEGPGLSRVVSEAVIRETCAYVEGRVPVLAGTMNASFQETIGLADYAADQGADGLVWAPPFYYPMDQSQLLRYARELLANLPLPVMLYNIPDLTGVAFMYDTVRELIGHQGVAGLKDSSGDMVYFNSLIPLFREHPEKSLLVGPEELLGESVLLGGHGGVSGGANFYPVLYVRLYEATRRGDLQEIRRLQDLVMTISQRIYQSGGYGVGPICGIKAALACMGICSDTMIPPYVSLSQAAEQTVSDLLSEYGLLDDPYQVGT